MDTPLIRLARKPQPATFLFCLMVLAAAALHSFASAQSAGKQIGLFIALCDNEHQGIAPVPKAIGNGSDSEQNLYWGCSEGFKKIFGGSPAWKIEKHSDFPASSTILREYTYLHQKTGAHLVARAYRGDRIRDCIRDFEKAILAREY